MLSGLWTWWLKTLIELRIENVSMACHRLSATTSDSIMHWHFVTNAWHSAHLPRGFLYLYVIYLFIFISVFIFAASSEQCHVIGKNYHIYLILTALHRSKNTTPINLINLLCILLLWLTGVVFTNCTMLSDKYNSVNECTQQIYEITYSRGVANCPWNLVGKRLIDKKNGNKHVFGWLAFLCF